MFTGKSQNGHVQLQYAQSHSKVMFITRIFQGVLPGIRSASIHQRKLPLLKSSAFFKNSINIPIRKIFRVRHYLLPLI